MILTKNPRWRIPSHQSDADSVSSRSNRPKRGRGARTRGQGGRGGSRGGSRNDHHQHKETKKEPNNNYEKPKEKVVEESGDGGDWADLMAEEERVVEPISSRDTRRKDSWASEMNNFEVC